MARKHAVHPHTFVSLFASFLSISDIYTHTHCLMSAEMLSNQSCWWDGLGTQGLEVSGMKKMAPPL